MNPLPRAERDAQPELVWRRFQRRTTGYFVEVGANDPREGSMTWLLEQRGWTGLLVEPQAGMSDRLKRQRPNSRVVQAACTSPERVGQGILRIPMDTLNGFASLEHSPDTEVEFERTETVRLLTLDSILAEAGNPRIDFISIDTEGTELDVLRGFSLGRHQPALMLMEDKLGSLEKHRYLARQGYQLVKRTELNNWYILKGQPFDLTSPWEKVRLFRKVFLGMPFRRFQRWRQGYRLAAGDHESTQNACR